MNLEVPRNNHSDLLFFLWKIIDVPQISLNNLLYKISFELFLFPPEEATNFIDICIENNLIILNKKGDLNLSKSLSTKLKVWQKRRRDDILQKINSTRKINQLQNDIETGKSKNFNMLFKSFVDKGTLNRAARVTNKAFDIKQIDFVKGELKATVSGSKGDPYIIEIDLNEKLLKHNCHDFEARRSQNKQFCKHLAKFILLLRENYQDSIELLLKSLYKNIDKWEFIS
ncbi:MAG: hypothetical protein ACW98D_04420 [Promethearchaeota archaeon]|jgi:hypothetical protein